ncbi:unnamed protein product [Scytosiphon promiscuus]
MPGRPWSASTRLFSSADDSSDSSDTSSGGGGWDRSARQDAAGRGSPRREVSPSKLALPALAAALRASRARASAAQAKASSTVRAFVESCCGPDAIAISKSDKLSCRCSMRTRLHRLLEETERLRAALKIARKGEERAKRCESDLANSEIRARQLESDNRRLRRDLDGARLRTRQTEEKAGRSLSALRSTLENLEQSQRERCKRWRATTRSQRALLESLRRHVQRGHHTTPSYTAFQLIEQIFECLKSLESDAGLPLSPPSSRTSRRQRPSPAAVATGGGTTSPHRRRPRTPPAAPGHAGRMAEGLRLSPPPPPSRWSDRDGGSGDDADSLGGAYTRVLARAQERGSSTGTRRTSCSPLSCYSFRHFQRASSSSALGDKQDRDTSKNRCFVVVSPQEELRCRQLEHEVDGLSSKVAAADAHRRRLETMLKEAKRERDTLKRREHSTAATHVLTAALDALHQRGRPASPPAYARAPSPPAEAFRPTAAAPQARPATATSVQTATVPVAAATASEALEYGRGEGLEPGALAPPRPTTGDRTPASPPLLATAFHDSPFYTSRHKEAREIQRIVDDAVANGTRRKGVQGTGFGGPGALSGDSAADATDTSKTARLEADGGDGGRYAWRRDPGPSSGGSNIRGGDGSTRAAAPAPPSRPPPPQAPQPPVPLASRGALSGEIWPSAREGTTSRAPPPRVSDAAGRRWESKVPGGTGLRVSSLGQLGPRAVTREDLTRLDDEIANLSKTVEEAAMAQTRQRLRNVAD